MVGTIGGFTIDKRLSVGHIVTTLTVSIAMIAWMIKLESRLTAVELIASQSVVVAAQTRTELRDEASLQYQEIIRRLERIDNQLMKEANKDP